MPASTRPPGIATAKAGRARAARAAFEASYAEYQYRFVNFFVEHLEDLSRVFRGDLQQMIILAIIGQVALKALRAGATPEEAVAAPPCISASRIADVTGIPRQTVRRKLKALADQGWVVQGSDGTWSLVMKDGRARARERLNEVDQRAIERVARLFADLEAIVQPRGTCSS